MQLPVHFLPRPPIHLDDATIAAFDALFEESVRGGPQQPIAYRLAAPKWQFLCYLSERKRVVLHGSGDPDLAELQPRQSNDVDEFGARRAIYAAADGIWPIFFAVVHRDGPVTSVVNSCTHVVAPEAARGAYYFFSIDADPTAAESWRNGVVYILPGETFERHVLPRQAGFEMVSTQVASLTAVRPLAKLAVGPQDFPFLDRVRQHNPVELRPRAEADPSGFPWLDP